MMKLRERFLLRRENFIEKQHSVYSHTHLRRIWDPQYGNGHHRHTADDCGTI